MYEFFFGGATISWGHYFVLYGILYNLIFWYCDIEENLNKLFDQETSQKTYMELTMHLYKESELDPIMTYINEKKSELNSENQNQIYFKD